jgi:hypothetical protein
VNAVALRENQSMDGRGLRAVALLCAALAAASCGRGLTRRLGPLPADGGGDVGDGDGDGGDGSAGDRDATLGGEVALGTDAGDGGAADRDATLGGDVAPGTDAGDGDAGDGGAGDRDATLGGEVSPGALAPSDVANVALWLDAAANVVTSPGGAVTSWADRSPNNHVAFPAGVGPTLLSDAGHGQPGVHFAMAGADNQRLVIADHASLRWGTGDFAIGAVVAYDNPPVTGDLNSMGLIYSKQVGPAPYPGPALFANDGSFDPVRTSFRLQVEVYVESSLTSDTTGYNDGKFHVVFALRRGMTLIIRADGAVVGSKTMGSNVDISIPGTDVIVGGAAGGGEQQLDGTLLELCAFAGPIDDTQLEAVERYFSVRHGLP